MVLVFRQWGKVLPSPLHSQEPRARKGIKKSDLRVENVDRKRSLPRREGGTASTHYLPMHAMRFDPEGCQDLTTF